MVKPSGGMGLNIAAIKQKNAENGIRDFQDDFMANFDEFSESWREACKHMRKLWSFICINCPKN